VCLLAGTLGLANACGGKGGGNEPDPVPSNIAINAGNGQSAQVNAAVAIDPAVKVTAANGDPVSGVDVAFSVASGGGSVQGGTTQTDGQGVARVSAWMLGPNPGPNTLTADVTGTALSVTFNATGVMLSPGYDIDVRPVSSLTPSQSAAFASARARLELIITNDESNLQVTLDAGDCFPNQPALDEVIDDLLIYAEVGAIDGVGGILGQAGPCIIRTSSFHPIVGFMRFDVADLNNLEASGLLETTILHEMQHVIGFGTIWANRGVLTGSGTADPFFTGANAIAGFDGIGGLTYPGNKVPVENTGGPGTANGHWRESVFDNELMTGFVNQGVANPLSVVTVEQFHDLGYTVNTGAADNFSVGPFPAPPRVTATGFQLRDDIWRGPLFEVNPAGTIRRITRP
jgi:hypothetical protein